MMISTVIFLGFLIMMSTISVLVENISATIILLYLRVGPPFKKKSELGEIIYKEESGGFVVE